MWGFESGQRVLLPRGPAGWVNVDHAHESSDGSWTLYVAADGHDLYHKVVLGSDEAAAVPILIPDGGAASERALAALWTHWLSLATAHPTTPLIPYPHQISAVYGAMLPQPHLRFLLADEPGTGKTIMAGLYLREARRSGIVRRALVVAPAGLTSKWQADFDRFFGGGLHRVTSTVARDGGIPPHWRNCVVSLELAAVNPAVLDAIDPDRAGWDLVVFDEAHRLTPTAQALHRVGRLLTARSPRALLLTATPHRGSEWLFRHLLHLVDPEIYPDPGDDPKRQIPALRPGSLHFLRRMKEELVDHDGHTPLFHGRRATNRRVPLSLIEQDLYQRALTLVDSFFPSQARALARMVYGKRAASTLHALAETLRRRLNKLLHRTDEETLFPEDERDVISAPSLASAAEVTTITELLDRVQAARHTASKWTALVQDCLEPNGIFPGDGEQAVVFTEYADSADWIAERLNSVGYSALVYSGRLSHGERDDIRARFARREFQVIVSTDAGNEGIDLQSAHVLVNYDIPWSLVRLEQRMGRIHRVGQHRDVELYNLVAVETREGETLLTLLESFTAAAQELDGRIFDSLSLVAELADVRYEEWLHALYSDDEAGREEAMEAASRVNTSELRRRAEFVHEQESALASAVETMAEVARVNSADLEPPGSDVRESYLKLLDSANLMRVRATAASASTFHLSSRDGLPLPFGSERTAVVSTVQIESATLDSGTPVIGLAPGSPPLSKLLTWARSELATDAFRGGTVVDPKAVEPYDLYAFEAPSDGSFWSCLVRVGAAGAAHAIDWDVLTRLRPTRASGGAAVRDAVARAEASRHLAGHLERRQNLLHVWLDSAERDLANLPVDLTMGIPLRSDRIALRDHLEGRVRQRLDRLRELCRVDKAPTLRLLARIRVLATEDDR
ncbi:DEAD/DEAH box helicase [Nonomuraea sp. NPDC059007]|uniref:DEAD/DEAH box helicase n=1 Tax=Nonomuraea sp. NPDC059007 TaxID=3346692 RepID=UPI00368BAF00